jgi:anthranilate synthase component 1
MRPPLTARVPGWFDPALALELLADDGADVALLESTDDDGTSVLAFGDAVDVELPRVPLDPGASAAPAAVGWLGYEGDARWLRVSRSVEFDHAARALTVHGDEAWLQRVRGAAASAVPLRPLTPPAPITGRWRHDDAHYLSLIARCQAAIVEGDAYQLCLTNTATVRDAPGAWHTYRRLRLASPTHHAGFVRLGDLTLVSASPERFVGVGADGVVRSSPIKGTRPRVADPRADDELAAELRGDEKEIAENLMIVDLVRNDLSRVAELGSVRVTRLLEVERYAQVHQLVSTVEASLRPGLTAADAVDALFPAGSMTGTPKLSAMGILRSLEDGPRGLYSGAFGLVRADGSADLAMVIRSIVFAGGTATVGAGGGITALSRPQSELAEVKLKAAPLLAALGASTPGPAAVE